MATLIPRQAALLLCSALLSTNLCRADDSSNISWRLDRARVVTAYAPGTAWTAYTNVIGGAQIEFDDSWSADLIFRFDGYAEDQTGNDGADTYTDPKLDGESALLKWTGDQNSLSAGYGIVRWGKTDEVSPVDRVAALDLTRFVLNDLKQRRRAVPLVRWQWFGDDLELDVVYRPWFRKARMPAFASIWSPVDRHSGRIAGIAGSAQLASAVRNLPFTDDGGDSGGAAARLSGNHEGVDWAVSLQRQRRSAPYYRIEQHNGRATFVGQHPMRWLAGAEIAAAVGVLTFRAEGAYLSAEPVTTESGAYKEVAAVEAVAGFDWWPGDGDTLVVTQLALHWLDTDTGDILDQPTKLALNGTITTEWGRGDWEGQLRYSAGLDQSDYFVNPSVTWNGWAPHIVKLGAYIFGGREDTVMGFYDDNDQVTLEWNLKW